MQFDPTCERVDVATQQFTDLLNEISLHSLKLNKPGKNNKKKHSERWFHNECFTLRRILMELSNKKHNNPLDETIRHNYHATRKNYKKLIKSKKIKLLNSKINNLVNHKGNQRILESSQTNTQK